MFDGTDMLLGSMLIIMIVILIVSVVSLSRSESFGKIKRTQLISNSFMNSLKEGYQVPRDNRTFGDGNQFDYLLPSNDSAKKTVIDSITEPVKDLIKEPVNEPVKEPVTVSHGCACNCTCQQPVYNTGKTVVNDRDVITTSGQPLDTTTKEQFANVRSLRNFDNILIGTTSSRVAQSNDQQPKSVDMRVVEGFSNYY